MGEVKGNTAKLGDEILSYNELRDVRIEKEEEVEKLKDAIEETEEKLENKKDAIDKALEIYEKREEIENDIKEKESVLEDVENSVNNRKEELSKLTAEVKKKGEEPISLGAGHFVVGKDFPSGRYEATPVGRGSNFVVRNNGGRLVVNTILGRDDAPNYIFNAEEGFTVRSDAQAQLVPIE